ncbi:peptidylprolyl isomerase, partial [Candidatus Pelagibacter bacterium]
NYLRDFSKKYNTDIKGLKNIFENNDLDYEFYLDQIKIELAWQQLIFNMYKSKIIINENELNEELKKVNKVNEDLQDYKLSEIEILYENKNKYEEKINEIKNEIVKIGFENTAIKYSIASTSLDGGNLGWVSSKSLSNNIFNILEKMRINQVSRPIIKGESVILLKLIDKRTLSIDKKNLETLKQNIINAKKNELLNLFANNYLSKIKNNVLIEIKKNE